MRESRSSGSVGGLAGNRQVYPAARRGDPRGSCLAVRGGADKAANLRGESPLPSVARFGRLAYPT